MAIATFNSGETGLAVRQKINANFLELASVDNNFRELSGDWESSFSTVNNLSSDWSTTFSTVKRLSSTWGSGSGGGGSSILPSASILDSTYSQLSGLRLAGSLIPGQVYRITDFKLKWVDYIQNGANNTTNNIVRESSIVEPLLVQAVTNSKFSSEAKSLLYPEDIIYYDFEATTSTTWNSPQNVHQRHNIPSSNGWITRRIDTQNNIDFSYDWRHITVSCARLNLMSLSATSLSSLNLSNSFEAGTVFQNGGNIFLALSSVPSNYTGSLIQNLTNSAQPLSSYYFPIQFFSNVVSIVRNLEIPYDFSDIIQQPTFTTSLTSQGQAVSLQEINKHVVQIKNISASTSFGNVYRFPSTSVDISQTNVLNRSLFIDNSFNVLNCNLFDFVSFSSYSQNNARTYSNNAFFGGNVTTNTFLNAFQGNIISFATLRDNICRCDVSRNLFRAGAGNFVRNDLSNRLFQNNCIFGFGPGGPGSVQNQFRSNFSMNIIASRNERNLYEGDSISNNSFYVPVVSNNFKVRSLNNSIFGVSLNFSSPNSTLGFTNNTVSAPQTSPGEYQLKFGNVAHNNSLNLPLINGVSTFAYDFTDATHISSSYKFTVEPAMGYMGSGPFAIGWYFNPNFQMTVVQNITANVPSTEI